MKSHYCTACDGGWIGPSHDYDKVASLFVEDGIWDARPVVPIARGREQIRELYKRLPLAAIRHASRKQSVRRG